MQVVSSESEGFRVNVPRITENDEDILNFYEKQYQERQDAMNRRISILREEFKEKFTEIENKFYN